MKVIGVFAVLIFACSYVFAASGVSPASYEVDFEPGYSAEFVFYFSVGDDSADMYIEGALAKYVSLDKYDVSGKDEIVATLSLPDSLDIPGVNYIKIGARSTSVDVGGFIKVDVPYPGKYVEIGLNAPSVNFGEDVLLELELFGKGTDSVVVVPRIEIFLDGAILENVVLDSVKVANGSEVVVNFSLSTGGYSPGKYLAVAFADYDGGSVSVENPFSIGEFSVELVNYTKSFKKDRLGEFEIHVKSLWDDDIEEVYAEINIIGSSSPGFATTPKRLSAWGEENLTGFLDTTGIKGNSFEVEISLHYGDKITSEIVELEVEGFDYIFWFIILVVAVGLIFLIRRSAVFVKQFEKLRKKKE